MKLSLVLLFAASLNAQTKPPTKPAPKSVDPSYTNLHVEGDPYCHSGYHLGWLITYHGDRTDELQQCLQDDTKPAVPPAKQEKQESITGTGISFAQATPPADLMVTNETKDGVHTISVIDPNNHWRCVVSSTVPAHPGNPLHAEMTSFTLVCMDINGMEPATPVPSK